MKLEIADIYSAEGRKALVEAYTKSMWNAGVFQKTTWCGTPLLQIPEDMVMLAEVIWRIKPKVVIECGIYKGGGLLLYSSLLELMGGGDVIGIDIKSDLATQVQDHPLGRRIRLIQGDSGNPEIVDRIDPILRGSSDIMVILDSDHSADHVRKELKVFSQLVTPGSYLVVLDGVMNILHDVPGADPSWRTDNPETAIAEFLSEHPEFERDMECNRLGSSFGPGGYLRRKEDI
jgi:cephalosporin hydroxylase